MAPRTSAAAETADAALALAQAEPARAIDLANEALADEGLPPTDRSRALWALGLAKRELDDLDESAVVLRQAIDTAKAAGDDSLAAEITSSLALVMARTGDSAEALRLTAEAAPKLEGAQAARNEMQRGLILQRLGENRQALESYGSALGGLDEAGDRLAAARLRLNRSVIHVYSGALDLAAEDLEIAHRTAVELGQRLLEATSAQNLAFTHGRRGDIPRALLWFDKAERIYAELGGRRRAVTLRSDRAEVYAEAGLLRDALMDARVAVDDLRQEDEPPALADALFLLARIADIAGDGNLAAVSATEAGKLFEEQGRATWALMARNVGTLARLRTTADPNLLDEALALASSLDEEGWESEAARARIEAARLAFDHHDGGATIKILEPLEHRSPASEIDRVAQAEAMHMLESARGRDKEARGAIDRGLQLLDTHRATMGSPEIRAGMARHGVRLVAAALDQALAKGDPWRVLVAVDTWRARSMDFPPALPPDDADLAGALSELRQIESDLQTARTESDDTSELFSSRKKTEERIRRLTRLVEGDQPATQRTALRRTELTEALTGRALVAYFTRRGFLHAVWFDTHRWQMTEIGAVNEIVDDVTSTVFALIRLASARGSKASLAAASLSLDDSSERLSRRLVEDLGLPDVPVTVVPTGSLHRLPWNALPAMVGRPASVAPSVRASLRAARAGRPLGPDSRVTAVAGPGLDGARGEVERLARFYPGGSRLTGRNARVEKVMATLDGADIAHLAAHGTFRTDNPLFSSLRMADGPLTVYDLDRLRSVPPLVVMPACDSAVSEVGAGDELLGFASALLRIGVSSLIAPAIPIPDSATRPLMTALHRRIIGGASPAEALAETLASSGSGSPEERAARSGFMLLGA